MYFIRVDPQLFQPFLVIAYMMPHYGYVLRRTSSTFKRSSRPDVGEGCTVLVPQSWSANLIRYEYYKIYICRRKNTRISLSFIISILRSLKILYREATQNYPWDCNAIPWVPHIFQYSVLQERENQLYIETHTNGMTRTSYRDTVQNL